MARLYVLFFFLILKVSLFSQDNLETIEVIDKPQSNPWLFLTSLRILGADLGVGFKNNVLSEQTETIFWIFLGAGYEWPTFYRDPQNHLYNGDYPGFDPQTSPFYTRFNLKIDLGIAQGILFNDKIKENLLEAFIFYKVRYDSVLNDPSSPILILASGLPDRQSLYQNSFLVGFSFNMLDNSNLHLLPDGVYSEVSFEWGPDFIQTEWLNPEARPDFWRINFQTKAFLPLFDLEPTNKLNIFSSCLGVFFSLDLAGGKQIPINIQQTFGGRFARPGLGASVRGFEVSRFDGLFKAVLNSEVRFNLWQFEIIDVFTPGWLVFFDAGYYNYLYYPEEGFIFSTGLGIYINVFKFTSFSFYTIYVMGKPLCDGSYWVPFVFAFDIHF